MSWPMSQDFNEAVQNPGLAFTDPDLREATAAVGAHGLPLPRSGNFADVYQLRGFDGRDWAVKCFTRPVPGLGDRYAAISEALADADFPFTVGFEFLPTGIKVGGAGRPVVKMEWVEGMLLNQVVRDNAGRPGVLVGLTRMWARLCKRLREAGVAHADLQHGNVMMVPGSRPGAYGLKLIDYDGMYLPALANTPSGEAGHPAYQHPARVRTRAYSPHLDRFPHLVVATALRGLAACGPELWERYDNGDNLLFTEADFQNPAASALMRELWDTQDPAVQALVGRLAVACTRAIPQTPWLDQVAPEGEPVELDAAGRRDAAAALGVPVPARAPQPARPPAEVVEVDVELFDTGAAAAATRQPGEPEKKSPRGGTRKRSLIPVLAAMVLLVGGAAAAVVMVVKRPNPDVAQTTKTEDPNGGAPKEGDPARPDNSSQPPPRPVERLDAVEAWSATLAPEVTGTRAVVTADGKFVVVTESQAGTYATFDAATGRPLPDRIGRLAPSTKLTPLTGSRVSLASLAPNTPVAALDLATGQRTELPAAALPNGMVSAHASPDLQYVAVGGSNSVDLLPFKLTRVADGKTVLDLEWVRGHVLFTADSSRVLVAEWSGRCRWFKLPGGEPDGEWQLQPREVAGPAGAGARLKHASADGSVLLYDGRLTGQTGGYHVLDGKTGRVRRSFSTDYVPGFGSLSSDGTRAALGKRGPQGRPVSIEVLNTATGDVVSEIPAAPERTYSIPMITPDGSAVVALVGPARALVRYDLVRPGTPPRPKDPTPPTGQSPRVIPAVALDLLDDALPKAALLGGWKKKATDFPVVVANPGDRPEPVSDARTARLPAHAIGVHPGPNEFVGVAWKSPITGSARLTAKVAHLDRTSGNGVAWRLEVRRGATATVLSEATLEPGTTANIAGAAQRLVPGDVVLLTVDARDGNTTGDFTELALALTEVDGAGRTWDLGADVADSVAAGNPHADRHGNKDTWSFVRKGSEAAVPLPKDKASPPDALDAKARWTARLNAGQRVNRVQVAADGGLVLLSEPQGVYPPLDAKTGDLRPRFDALERAGVLTAVPLDGGRVASLGTRAESLTVWDATGKEGATRPVPDVPPGVGNAKGLRANVSPDGRYLAVGRAGLPAGDNPEVAFRVFEAESGRPLVTTTWRGGTALFTADSSRVLVAEWAGRCRWFKLPAGEPAGGFNLGPPPAGRKHNFYGVTVDGAAVAYNGPFEQKDGTPAPGVLDGATGKWTQTFKQHFFASEVSLSADGRRAALLRDAAATECEFEVVDVKTGEGLVQVRFTGRDIPTAALTPDGTGLIVHDPATDKVRLFEVPDRRPR